MKFHHRWRLGQGKRPEAVFDPDARMVTSRALAGLFPPKILVRRKLIVWTSIGREQRALTANAFDFA
jgi:hypothetical protein